MTALTQVGAALAASDTNRTLNFTTLPAAAATVASPDALSVHIFTALVVIPAPVKAVA